MILLLYNTATVAADEHEEHNILTLLLYIQLIYDIIHIIRVGKNINISKHYTLFTNTFQSPISNFPISICWSTVKLPTAKYEQRTVHRRAGLNCCCCTAAVSRLSDLHRQRGPPESHIDPLKPPDLAGKASIRPERSGSSSVCRRPRLRSLLAAAGVDQTLRRQNSDVNPASRRQRTICSTMVSSFALRVYRECSFPFPAQGGCRRLQWSRAIQTRKTKPSLTRLLAAGCCSSRCPISYLRSPFCRSLGGAKETRRLIHYVSLNHVTPFRRLHVVDCVLSSRISGIITYQRATRLTPRSASSFEGLAREKRGGRGPETNRDGGKRTRAVDEAKLSISFRCLLHPSNFYFLFGKYNTHEIGSSAGQHSTAGSPTHQYP